MSFEPVSLDDKYTVANGRVFITGTQALVRLPMMQHLRDAAAGLHTACYITGYRGSPLGQIDQQLWAAAEHLKTHHIVFQPGVNEELAATACWGTQQAHFGGDNKYDGVFALWYGKGPGVDRSGDALRHGNLAGSAANGGVICLMGDDHTCESSTTAHQSEFAMVDAMIPILNPAGVQELLDYGLIGWALSRYSGCWVGLKCVKDTVDASASVNVSTERVRTVIPTDFTLPQGGLNIRWPDAPLDQEARLHNAKLEAAKAFARANRIDSVTMDGANARLGIATCGKSYMDVRQALQYLGMDEAGAPRLRLYKIGMTWPLEPEGVRRFAEGLDKILVVEEKRGLIESQIKEILYHTVNAPAVVGKRDESGNVLLCSNAALDPTDIAIAIGRRLLEYAPDASIATRLAEQERLSARVFDTPAMERLPSFCSGCPHNTGTRLPQGSRALAGIGCHYMAQWTDPDTQGYTQMGGEGASWVGKSPFVKTPHMFQNIGDGTYFHSGLLALRAAAASGANVTYKVLYNDAVAMTGGQPLDGNLSASQITLQVYAEGAKKIAVVTDDPGKYPPATEWAPGVTIHHRDDYDAVQRQFREVPGLSVIVYDQTCAAEKRRRRKRGTYPDPAKRVFINDLVCEGCGDCGVQSSCASLLPLETEFGRKRAIDQSACNKDYACVKGFCPSFVTVHGGKLRKGGGGESRPAGAPAETVFTALPEPALPDLREPYGIVVAGIGGTGVVTIGAIVGMAAHLEGRGFGAFDMAGLAQKGGAVWSHLQVAADPAAIKTARLGSGGANLLLACDLVVGASRKIMVTAGHGTRVIANTHQQMTRDFARNPDVPFPAASLQRLIAKGVGDVNAEFVDATRLATALLGDAIAANMFMLGYAYQRGLVPVSGAAIHKALELNGTAVTMNQSAFLWGRRTAVDAAAVERCAAPRLTAPSAVPTAQSFEEMVARRVAFLADYQDAAYGQKYRQLVERVQQAERVQAKGFTGLARAVARNYFKLMAYKDEYEVARLYTDPAFREKMAAQFEGDYRLRFHLAPPLLAKRDPVSGELRKAEYGSWVLSAFSVLARLRRVRGTALDVFGYTRERRMERRLIVEYEATIDELLTKLTTDNHPLALQIAALPEQIRGYGHVKERSVNVAQAKQTELLAAWRSPAAARTAA